MSASISSTPAFGSSIRWGILSAGKISADFVKAMSITEGAGKLMVYGLWFMVVVLDGALILDTKYLLS